MRRGVAQLESLATLLLAGIPLRPGDPPRLARVVDGGNEHDDQELGIVALHDGAHPLDALAGMRAPDDWQVLGTVCTGTATDLRDGRRFPTRCAHLVDRQGHWAAAYEPIDRDAGNAGACSGSAASADEPLGRIDDALRRALGLPTASPPGTTHLLWCTQWLDALVERAAVAVGGRRRRRAADRAAILALHPAVAAYDLDPSTLDPHGLVAHGERLARDRGWSQLRRAAAAGLWTHPAVDAELAAWLDDGAFARWVLGEWPELGDLFDAVGVLLTPDDLDLVDAALAEWGVLPPNPCAAAPT
jgi:hypothetical protein